MTSRGVGLDPIFVGCQGLKFGPFTRLRTPSGIDLQFIRSFTIEMFIRPQATPLVGNLFAIEYDIVAPPATAAAP
jgi:hypothetical protein